MNTAIQNDLNKQAEQAQRQTEDVRQKIKGLENVSRLINNTLSIIGETDIKGGYAKAVAEIQDWLQGFDTQVKSQKVALESLLPKEMLKETPKLIEIAEVPVEVK